MAIIEKKIPYEFLVRWDSNGKLAGAHIGFLNQVVKDGTIIAEAVDQIFPVSLIGEVGFPLAEVLSLIEINALTALEAKESELLATIESNRIATETLKEDHAKELASLNAIIRNYEVASTTAIQPI